MKKNILFCISFFWAVCVSADPFHDCQINGINYHLYDNSTAEVISCSSCSGSITIPSSFYYSYNSRSYTVIGIGDYAFRYCRSLTSVTIPNSVTTIGMGAFYGCSGLTSITIPNSVTWIGKAAFYDCSGLTSIIIPNSVKTIEGSAFAGCSGITSIVMPNSITSIGNRTFFGCSGLTSIDIPSSVTTIGDYAFYGCSGLTSIDIPSGVTTIGDYAFYDCSCLKSVPHSLKEIGNHAFDGCSGLTSITTPSSATKLGNSAFCGCTNLTSVTIGSTNVGDSAFYNCDNLVSVKIESSVKTMGKYAFYDCTNLPIENNIRYADTYLVEVIDKTLSSYDIKNGTKWIGDKAFLECENLTSIVIPNSVTSIGNSAFHTSTYQITGISHIGSISKKANNNLISVIIGDSVVTIGDSAFYGCNHLKSIVIPKLVRQIGAYAFAGCDNLTMVSIGNSVYTIGDYAFYKCWQLKYIICYPGIGFQVYEHTFSGININAKLYIPGYRDDEYYITKPYLKDFEFSTGFETSGAWFQYCNVTPGKNYATFEWTRVEKASYYILEIAKDSIVCSTMRFGSEGCLRLITFTPMQNTESQITQVSKRPNFTSGGYIPSYPTTEFTIWDLETASLYTYTLTAFDNHDQIITQYSGNFATDGYTDLLPLPYEGKDGIGSVKFIHNGRLLIERNGILYDAHGARVK